MELSFSLWRTRFLMMVVMCVPCASRAQTPIADLAGRYSAHFKNGMVDGSTYWSDDVAEIVPISDRNAYFHVHLEFYNGHECDISGVGQMTSGVLVYSDGLPPLLPDEGKCVLRLQRLNDTLSIDDGDRGCQSYCGARGSLLGETLPLRSRRPITYLARLKTSREFTEALANWNASRSP